MKHKPEYQQQIENLKSGTIAEKRMALDSLSTSKHNIVPALESVILSAEDKYLGWTLEGYDWERGEGKKYDFKLIEDTIQYDCWYVFAVTYLLVGFREASIDTLIPLLTDERPIIRSWVALVLGEIGDERAIPPLLERLTSPDHRELWCVCEALGKLRAIEAVEPLIGLLGMGVVGVEGAAAHALGKIGDLRALMPLIEQLKQQKPSVYSVSAALYLFGEHAIIPLTD